MARAEEEASAASDHYDDLYSTSEGSGDDQTAPEEDDSEELPDNESPSSGLEDYQMLAEPVTRHASHSITSSCTAICKARTI